MSLFKDAEKKHIKDLKINDSVDWFYRIVSVAKRKKRNGGFFLNLELMDKTGRIPAKIWNNIEQAINLVKEGEVFGIRGYVNEYMNKKEINIENVRPVSLENKINMEDFTEQPDFDTEQLFNELITTIKTNLKREPLIKLVDLFSQKYKEPFKNHYGAQKIHHNNLGGLLQHTFSIIRLVLLIADHYHGKLDKEILLIGALFHDIGKMAEFTIFPAAKITLEGGLIGHIVIGHEMFLDLTREIENFPSNLSLNIQHLVISHHGEKEFGSPEVPKTAEAFVLHYMDLMDSKLNILENILAGSEPGTVFSEYSTLLSRRVYIPEQE